MGKLSRRVQDYLQSAEDRERDVWLRDDLRQAWITVDLAARGLPHPFVTSSYVMYGLPPEKIWPAILERRKALLGPLYGEFFPGEELPPKKPIGTVHLIRNNNDGRNAA